MQFFLVSQCSPEALYTFSLAASKLLLYSSVLVHLAGQMAVGFGRCEQEFLTHLRETETASYVGEWHFDQTPSLAESGMHILLVSRFVSLLSGEMTQALSYKAKLPSDHGRMHCGGPCPFGLYIKGSCRA